MPLATFDGLEIVFIAENEVIGTIVLFAPQPIPAFVADDASPTIRRRAVRNRPPVELPTRVQVGDVVTFSGSHRVSGVAAIVTRDLIRVTNLRHDGSAPGLDLRIGLGSRNRTAFTVLRTTGRQAFNGETIDLPLSEGIDLNSFDTFTVWCYEFNVIIAEGPFRTP